MLQPGQALDAAYDAAVCGAAFSLAGGTWPAQTISGNRSCPDGQQITFREATGARVIVTDLTIQADHVTVEGIETGYATVGDRQNQYGVFVGDGSTSVVLRDVDAGSFSGWQASNVKVFGGDDGPCHQHTTGGNGGGVCDLIRLDIMDDVLIDGAHIHDFGYTSACVQAADCHWRPLYANGVNGVTIRNSTFRDSVFAPWFTISGATAGARGNSNILIENNQFGVQTDGRGSPWGEGLGFQFAWCQNGAQPSTRNVTFRFNSFARVSKSPCLGSPARRPAAQRTSGSTETCSVGSRPGEGNCGGPSGVVFSHNVYAGDRYKSTCGGTGEVWVGTATMPWYANNDPGPEPGDYRLTGAAFAGDDLVPASAGCPATDAAGRTRPSLAPATPAPTSARREAGQVGRERPATGVAGALLRSSRLATWLGCRRKLCPNGRWRRPDLRVGSEYGDAAGGRTDHVQHHHARSGRA